MEHIVYTSPLLKGQAEALATELTLKAVPQKNDEAMSLLYDENELHLLLSPEGLSLAKGELSMMGDFSELLPRLRQSNIEHEMIVKAAKPQKIAQTIQGRLPVLLDATAGMGEDSLILAAAGFKVIMYEYNPIIAALLEDTLKRALCEPLLKPIVERMELHCADSIEAMKKPCADTPVDVILLDPMFPERNKAAKIKKKFQLLQQLESPCSDEEEMLNAALQAKPKRIIIKRPLKGAFLSGIKPGHSLSGKAIRYDCLTL